MRNWAGKRALTHTWRNANPSGEGDECEIQRKKRKQTDKVEALAGELSHVGHDQADFVRRGAENRVHGPREDLRVLGEFVLDLNAE